MIKKLFEKLSSGKSLKDLNENEEKELVEMLEFYKSGKKMFWVFIGMGMLAGAATSILLLFKQISK